VTHECPGPSVQDRAWWTLLPGMNWRRRAAWPDRDTANAILITACVMKLAEVAGQKSSGSLAKVINDLRWFWTWLGEAETDGDVFLRRFTLCLLVSAVTPGDDLRDLREHARALYQRP